VAEAEDAVGAAAVVEETKVVQTVSGVDSLKMPANALQTLPALGSGLGFRERFRSELFLNRDRVDFLEITADHYLETAPEKRCELELLRDSFTLIPHGLSLSLGTAEGLDRNYLKNLAALVNSLDPPWWSEHIAVTHAGGIELGHLTPLPFSREAVEIVVRNISEVCQSIRAPLILENISYTMRVPGDEMTEADFLAEVLERADCGMLLDVTNLYTNAVNHNYDPIEFLDRIPLDRVVQLHYVGGHWSHGVLIDSHAAPTPEDVWHLIELVMERAPVKGAILERDINLPQFEDLLGEVDRARRVGRQNGRWA
jgi:uncharacterized protein